MAKPACRSSVVRPSGVNLALISVRSSSPASKRDRQVEGGDLDGLVALGPQTASRSTTPSSFQRATWLEAVGVEVGAEPAVEMAQRVAVERGGHAGGVVVGGDQDVGVLDQVDAEQETVVAVHRCASRSNRNRRRWLGSRLPIVPPRNATSRRPSPWGIASRWRMEVADHRMDIETGVVRPRIAAAAPDRLLRDVEGHVALERRPARSWRRAGTGSCPRCPSRARPGSMPREATISSLFARSRSRSARVG